MKKSRRLLVGNNDGRVPIEELQHIEAFEYYYSLGSDRGYEKVSKKFNLPCKLVENWGARYKWKDKLRARQKRISDEIEKRAVFDATKTKLNFKNKIDAILEEFLTDVRKNKNDYKTFIRTIDDVERLIKLSLLLVGETLEKAEGGGMILAQKSILMKGLKDNDVAQGALRQLYQALNADAVAIPPPVQEDSDDGEWQ